MNSDTLTFTRQSDAIAKAASIDTALGYPKIATRAEQSQTGGRHVPLAIAATTTCGEIVQQADDTWALRLESDAIATLTAPERTTLRPISRKAVTAEAQGRQAVAGSK